MAIANTPDLANVPGDLVRAVAYQAEQDANRVVLFLDTLFGHSPGVNTEPVPLPLALLLGLGAALRLLIWECNGTRGLLPVDLPDAREAIQDLMVAAVDRCQPERLDSLAYQLALLVLRVWVDHFAWYGPDMMSADLVLGSAEEDALADELARFLWANRYALAVPGRDAFRGNQRKCGGRRDQATVPLRPQSARISRSTRRGEDVATRRRSHCARWRCVRKAAPPVDHPRRPWPLSGPPAEFDTSGRLCDGGRVGRRVTGLSPFVGRR
jgi:hypothetical protein